MEFSYKSNFTNLLKSHFYSYIAMKSYYGSIVIFILYLLITLNLVIEVEEGILYNFIAVTLYIKFIFTFYVLVMLVFFLLFVLIESLIIGQLNQELHCTIDSNGINEIAKNRVTRIEWDKVKKVIVNQDIIVVIAKKRSSWLILKCTVGQEKFNKICETIYTYYQINS